MSAPPPSGAAAAGAGPGAGAGFLPWLSCSFPTVSGRAAARRLPRAAGQADHAAGRPLAALPSPAIAFCTDSARSEEHTSELQSLMRISYAVFCLQKKKDNKPTIESLRADTASER